MVRMHIVEPWRLFLLSSASLCGAGVESTGAHGMRTCRPFASSAFGCECLSSPPAMHSESLSTAGLSRCPRTVLKAQLLLFATCKGEANALRKSRLRDELLLVKGGTVALLRTVAGEATTVTRLSLIHISEPTRPY